MNILKIAVGGIIGGLAYEFLTTLYNKHKQNIADATVAASAPVTSSSGMSSIGPGVSTDTSGGAVLSAAVPAGVVLTPAPVINTPVTQTSGSNPTNTPGVPSQLAPGQPSQPVLQTGVSTTGNINKTLVPVPAAVSNIILPVSKVAMLAANGWAGSF